MDKPSSVTPTPSVRKIQPNVWILTITSFLTDISSEMMVNLVPIFLVSVLNVSTVVVGLIDGVAETTASLLKIFSGGLSDKLGSRKWLTVLGYGISTLAKPFMYFANTWPVVLGVRFADRTGKGIRTAPRDALLAGSVDKDQRGLAFGIHRAGDTLGAFLGLGVAALIVWLTEANSKILTRDTFQIIILASIIPALLAVIILALGAKEVASPSKAKMPVLSFKGMDKRFIAFLAVTVVFALGNSSDSFIILRGKERGLSIFELLLMAMTFNLVYALLSGPAGALSDKIGRRRLILFGWLAYGLIYLGFALSGSAVGIWVFFGLYGIYYAMTDGVGKALIADLVPEEKRGTAYGLYAAAVGLMALPASLIAGLLWQGLGSWMGFGPAAPFYFGAAMALLAGIGFSVFVKAK